MTKQLLRTVLALVVAAACRADDHPTIVLPSQELVVFTGQFCGGIAQFPCSQGFTCVDDPRDDCDPETGGADCGGVCVAGPNDPNALDRNGDRVICVRAANGIGSLRGAFIDNSLPGGACPRGFTRVTLPS